MTSVVAALALLVPSAASTQTVSVAWQVRRAGQVGMAANIRAADAPISAALYVANGTVARVWGENVQVWSLADGRSLIQRTPPAGQPYQAAARLGADLYAITERGVGERFSLSPTGVRTTAVRLSGVRTLDELVAAAGLLFAADRSRNQVSALTPDGARVLWTFPTPPGSITALRALQDGTLLIRSLFIRAPEDNRMFVLDGRTGALLREQPLSTGGELTVRGEWNGATLYLQCGDDQLWRTSNADGAMQWIHPFATYTCASTFPPIQLDGTQVIGAGNQRIEVLDGVTGRLLRSYRVPNGAVDGILRVTPTWIIAWLNGESPSGDAPADASYLLFIDRASGQITRRQMIPAGEVVEGIASTSDGFVVATSDGIIRRLVVR